MILIYLKLFFNKLKHSVLINFINVISLLLGLLSFVVLLAYINYEKSFDKFHKDCNDLYRITITNNDNSSHNKGIACTSPGIGSTLASQFSEIIDYTRYCYTMTAMVKSGENVFYEKNTIYTDASFFKMFSFKIIKGGPYNLIDEPNSIFISAETAKKYFGKDDPINKVLEITTEDKKKFNCVVKGVVELPMNSNFEFNILLPMKNLAMIDPGYNTTLYFDFLYTYVKLKPNTSIPKFEKKINAHLKSFYNDGRIFKLQPVKDIYLYSGLRYDGGRFGNGNSLKFLSLVSFIIILISLINYINLSTSQAIKRFKEFAINKVFGADKKSIFKQICLEVALFCSFIFVIGIIVFLLIIPFINNLLGKAISFTFIFSPLILYTILFSILIIALYITLLQASINPIEILKGKNKIAFSKGTMLLKKFFLTFQFIFSIALIIFTLTISRQLNLMYKSDLGMDFNNVMALKAPLFLNNDTLAANKLQAFIKDLEKAPFIKSVSGSFSIPGSQVVWTLNYTKSGSNIKTDYPFSTLQVTSDYLNTFGLKLIAGRNFHEDLNTDKNSIIIDKKSVLALGYKNNDDAIGQILISNNKSLEIVGVVDVFHQQAFKVNEVLPIVLLSTNDPGFLLYISAKMVSVNKDAVNKIKEKWNEFFPESAFDIVLVKDTYYQQYSQEKLIQKLVFIFTILSIIITCLGIGGISYSEVLNRNKEIAIRKILGSKIISLLLLFSRNFIQLIIIASIVAIPLVLIFISNWLNNYSKRINLPYDLGIVAVLLMVIISIITVSLNIFVISRMNPADAIKDDN